MGRSEDPTVQGDMHLPQEVVTPWGWADLTRVQYNRYVLFYIVTGRENKKNGPKTVSVIHLCFHRPSETTSKAMKNLGEIEIQATQVRNCLALKSFKAVLSNKCHLKCLESDTTSGSNSFETNKKMPTSSQNSNCQASALFNWQRMQ